MQLFNFEFRNFYFTDLYSSIIYDAMIKQIYKILIWWWCKTYK